MDTTYPPLRKTLIALRREFRRCAAKYPPLYHDRIAWWDPDRIVEISDAAWQSFIEVEKKAGDDLEVTWDGPFGTWIIGRFFGDPSGLDEFCRLAESVVLALAEFTDVSTDEGHVAWLEILHRYAFNQETPLLRSHFTLWGFDELPGADELDGLTSEWSGPPNTEGAFPLHPYVWRLSHSVFVSSIAAIDAILDPQSVLLVGEPLDRTPIFPEPSSTVGAGTPTAVESNDSRSLAEPRHSGCLLRKVGSQWQIQFQINDVLEDGYLDDEMGIRCYAELLSKPNKWLSGNDLIAAVKPGPSSSRSAISKAESLDAGHSGSVGGGEVQKKIEGMTKTQIEKAIEAAEEARRQAEANGELEKEEELDQCIRSLRSALSSKGGSRREAIFPTNDERIRHRVANARGRCHEEMIGKKMPQLVKFLKQSVRGTNFGFIYQPDTKIEWEVSW